MKFEDLKRLQAKLIYLRKAIEDEEGLEGLSTYDEEDLFGDEDR
jgi:hypothetical protein